MLSAPSSPALSASQLAEAALHGCHDTILLLTIVSLFGFILALLLKRNNGNR
jgi:hypothetical protein